MYLKVKAYWSLIIWWNPALAPAMARSALLIWQNPAPAGFPKSKSYSIHHRKPGLHLSKCCNKQPATDSIWKTFNPVRTIKFAHLTLSNLEQNWMWAPAFLHLGLITEQSGWRKAFIASKYLHFAISLYLANMRWAPYGKSVCSLLQTTWASGLQHLYRHLLQQMTCWCCNWLRGSVLLLTRRLQVLLKRK